MNEIGGYFGLELNQANNIYHPNAIALNTARNAIEYLLIANKYKKIYIPYFTCEVILQPIKKLKIAYSFYSINEDLEPIFDFNLLNKNTAFLYTNYFGIKDKYILNKLPKLTNIIIDNAQSFFSNEYAYFDSFNSARKFFGVPDGAYLYSQNKINQKFDTAISYKRMEHLLIRLDINAQTGYEFFKKNDESLHYLPIQKMSNLTTQILSTIQYKKIATIRKNNFLYLHNNLHNFNLLKIGLNKNAVPLTYPLLLSKKINKKKLINNYVYVAQYWPNVKQWTKANQLENKLSEQIIHLPIDQRYNENDLTHILNILHL